MNLIGKNLFELTCVPFGMLFRAKRSRLWQKTDINTVKDSGKEMMCFSIECIVAHHCFFFFETHSFLPTKLLLQNCLTYLALGILLENTF